VPALTLVSGPSPLEKKPFEPLPRIEMKTGVQEAAVLDVWSYRFLYFGIVFGNSG